VARVAQHDPATLPALMIDIGSEDGLLEQNRAFRSELLRLGVPHRYAERLGRHDWDYWRTHAPSSLRWIAERIGESP
jgi:S-formylglutathione hydrolase FrmB